MTKIQLDKK